MARTARVRTLVRVATVSALAAIALPLTPQATSAPAGTSTPVVTEPNTGGDRSLLRLAAVREQGLADLERQAERHENELRGLREVLSQYGYWGEPDEATVIVPITNYRFSAGFGLTGPLWESTHGGQDFSAALGEPLVAVGAGVITDVGDAGPYGLRVILTLEDGTEIWYCHLSSSSVSVGDEVAIADLVGAVGSTGNSTGPHLHLEVRPGGGAPGNPLEWFSDAGLF